MKSFTRNTFVRYVTLYNMNLNNIALSVSCPPIVGFSDYILHLLPFWFCVPLSSQAEANKNLQKSFDQVKTLSEKNKAEYEKLKEEVRKYVL